MVHADNPTRCLPFPSRFVFAPIKCTHNFRCPSPPDTATARNCKMGQAQPPTTLICGVFLFCPRQTTKLHFTVLLLLVFLFCPKFFSFTRSTAIKLILMAYLQSPVQFARDSSFLNPKYHNFSTIILCSSWRRHRLHHHHQHLYFTLLAEAPRPLCHSS